MLLARITLVVRDYDEAINFYTTALGFRLLEDTNLGDGKRWVRIAPPGAKNAEPTARTDAGTEVAREASTGAITSADTGAAFGAELLLARAATPDQQSRIGNQTGGRVFLFLETKTFDADLANLKSRGIRIIDGPRTEPCGKVAVILDCYGNKIDLIEPT